MADPKTDPPYMEQMWTNYTWVAHPLAVGLLFINGRIAGNIPYLKWIPDQVEEDRGFSQERIPDCASNGFLTVQ